MAQLAKLSGKPPPTKAQTAGAPLETMAALEADMADGTEETSEDLDKLRKLAMLKLLGKDSHNRRKKVGLMFGQGESSDSEEDDPLRKLSGAKGTMLLERLRASMDASPSDYVTAIEHMAANSLGMTQATSDTLERFAREELPVGNDRNMGYMVWILVKAIGLLRAKQHDKAHLLLMLGVAALEQYKLDQNWSAAWRLTHLPQPPFQEWKVREASISQLRHDFAHSRLIHSTWAAAITARMKDEEVLVKRRCQARAPGAPKGKGKGGKAEPAEAPQ